MNLQTRFAAFTLGLTGMLWSVAAYAVPPLVLNKGSFSSGDVQACVAFMTDVMNRVGLPNPQVNQTLVIAETDSLSVILSCQEGDGSKTHWTLAIAGLHLDEAERANQNIVRSITR